MHKNWQNKRPLQLSKVSGKNLKIKVSFKKQQQYLHSAYLSANALELTKRRVLIIRGKFQIYSVNF